MSKKRVLITGVNGFAGSHLARLLINKGKQEVIGTVLPGTDQSLIKDLRGSLKVEYVDIRKKNAVARLIKKSKPDQVYHLAALIFTQHSWSDPFSTYMTNFFGTFNLLEALRQFRPRARTLITSSGVVYGDVAKKDLPASEAAPLRPVSPYAVSKAAQELLGYQYAGSYKMDIVITRAFSNTGPGENENLACSSFAKQIARAERSSARPVILVGDLSSRRDMLDVRDLVRAYALVMKKGKRGQIYNACSGRSIKMAQLLQMMIKQSGKKILVRRDPSRLRLAGSAEQRGTYRKLARETGWKPEIPLRKSLADLLNYWRKK